MASSWNNPVKCNKQWVAIVDERNVYCTCIRRVGHEGNHVSYPSGEELRQFTKKPKLKTLK